MCINVQCWLHGVIASAFCPIHREVKNKVTHGESRSGGGLYALWMQYKYLQHPQESLKEPNYTAWVLWSLKESRNLVLDSSEKSHKLQWSPALYKMSEPPVALLFSCFFFTEAQPELRILLEWERSDCAAPVVSPISEELEFLRFYEQVKPAPSAAGQCCRLLLNTWHRSNMHFWVDGAIGAGEVGKYMEGSLLQQSLCVRNKPTELQHRQFN